MNDSFKTKFRIDELKILEFKFWIVSVRPKQPTIGALVIALKRDCPTLHKLKPEETAELSIVFNKVESLLNDCFSYDKINYLALMMVDAHVHFHVIPRYENSIHFKQKKYTDPSWPGPIDLSKVIKENGIETEVWKTLNKKAHLYKKIIGYTTGVFDLFHIGHLNILRQAKENCDYLIVGVTVDELVSYKKVKNFIPYKERVAIIKSIGYVDKVIPQTDMDKMKAWHKIRFDKIFVGSDWKGSDQWNKLEKELAQVGGKVHYFPYTKGTSSTKLRAALDKIKVL